MTQSSSLHKGHRARMRVRFVNSGYKFDAFEDHEILEMILYSCYAQKNTNEIAHMLIDKFGSLEAVVKAPAEQLCEVKFVSRTAASHIRFYGELLDYIEREDAGKCIDLANNSELEDYLRAVIRGQIVEMLFVAAKTEHGTIRNLRMNTFDADDLYLNIAAFMPKSFVTVRVTADMQSVSAAEEISLAEKVRAMSSANEIEYVDHCLYDGEELRSLKDMGLL